MRDTNKLLALALISVTLFAGSTAGDENPFASNRDFWSGLEEDEEPYEHDFTQIPDLIQN